MSARPVIFTAIALSLLAAACGDESHDTAKFTGADDAHLRRTLDVITAGDAGSLLFIGLLVSGDNQTGCPSIVSVGPVTTVTGGCTTDDGARAEGRIIITNVQPIFSENPAVDPSKPMSVEAEGWSVVEETENSAIDGKVTITPAGATQADGGTLSVEVEATIDGITAHTSTRYTCDASDLCTLGSGSWISVDGVGEAELSGTFRMEDPRTGSILAKGAETLLLDVVASVDDCKAFSIDGGAGQMVCEPTDQIRQVPRARFLSSDARLLLPAR